MIFNTIVAGGTKKWSKPCLKFSSKSEFTIPFPQNSSSFPDGKIEYSFDGLKWLPITLGDTISSSLDPQNSGLQVFYICGTGNTYIGSLFSGLLAENPVDCSGYVETLLDWESVALEKRISISTGHCFEGLFGEVSALRSGPSIYRRTFLNDYCYGGMFSGCNNLETLPKLFAINLPDYPYYQMFANCAKIMLSETQSDDYPTPYQIPFNNHTITSQGYGALENMFAGTGGTFTGTPELNKTYYLHKSCRIV